MRVRCLLVRSGTCWRVRGPACRCPGSTGVSAGAGMCAQTPAGVQAWEPCAFGPLIHIRSLCPCAASFTCKLAAMVAWNPSNIDGQSHTYTHRARVTAKAQAPRLAHTHGTHTKPMPSRIVSPNLENLCSMRSPRPGFPLDERVEGEPIISCINTGTQSAVHITTGIAAGTLQALHHHRHHHRHHRHHHRHHHRPITSTASPQASPHAPSLQPTATISTTGTKSTVQHHVMHISE